MPVGDLSRLKIDETARTTSGVRWLRWFSVAIGVIALAAAALFALRGRKPDVTVTTVHAVSTQSGGIATLNASGYVTPRRRSTIAAKITARVEQIYVDEGMHVSEGQVLATLDGSDYKVRLASAVADRDSATAQLADLQVNLENAERELHRTQELTTALVSTQQALDTARTLVQSYKARIAQTKAQVAAAERRVAVAQQDLANCTVRAPYSGIVVSKDAQRGEMVSPISAGGGFTRTGIVTVVDMKSIEVEVDVNESYIAKVKPGQAVTSILDAYPDWQIPSHVRTIIPTADRQKATVKVRISFDQLDPRILPDMGVKVSFLEDAPDKSATPKLIVPKSAIRSENGNAVVYLLRGDTVERRALKLGAERGEGREVLAGLIDGDKIVSDGSVLLRDGEQVNVRQ